MNKNTDFIFRNMKRKRFKHTMRRILQHAASWLLLFTVATACTQDELPEETPEESGKVTLMLQMEDIHKPTTRTWVSSTAHDEIRNVAIIGCRTDADGVERIKFVSHGYKPQHIEQNNTQVIVRMHLPAGGYTRLVVVTNAVEKFPTTLVGHAYNDLKQITYDGLNSEGKYTLPHVPMYGELNSPVKFLQGEAKTIPGNIKLVRMVTIVNVRNLSKSTFKLERVYIKNIRENTLIYYDKDRFNSQQPTLPSAPRIGHASYDVPAADEAVDGMYIYEQPAASFATGKGFNDIRIIAEGTLKSNGQKRFYPIDFVNHDGTAFAPVLRNHVYTFELRNITDDGYYNVWDAWIAKEILTNRVTPQNNSAINLYNKYYRNVVFNDHNMMASHLNSLQIRGGNRTVHLWVYTDFPGGWYAYNGADWFTISRDYGNVNDEAQLFITCTPTSTYRQADLILYAGQLKMWVPIQQWP